MGGVGVGYFRSYSKQNSIHFVRVTISVTVRLRLLLLSLSFSHCPKKATEYVLNILCELSDRYFDYSSAVCVSVWLSVSLSSLNRLDYADAMH